MNALTIIRTYLGMSQTALAMAADVTQPKLSRMEREPFGRVGKYRRIASVLDLPMEPIMKDDLAAIPLDFFAQHPPQPYLPLPMDGTALIGRQGEDFIFAREQARLAENLPVHAKLVLPLYKMKAQRIGCDILTYDDDGRPVCLEVKTTTNNSQVFSMTKNELQMADKFTKDGIPYFITFINNWDTPQQTVQDISYEDFLQNYDAEVLRYHCTPKKNLEYTLVTGLAHFRKLLGLTEQELAEAVGICQHKWSLYETGDREPPVSVLLAVSKVLDVPVDQLLDNYAPKEG